MKPKHALFAAIASCLLATPSLAQSADDAVGTWRHPENGSHIRISKCGARICGTISKVTDGQTKDDKNPDASKRNRPIVGLLILSAKKTGANTWAGSLYNRADGKTYSGNVTVNSKSSLDLSGCSGGIFCKTTTWSRVN
jgi:uncharacterized protein (DUF2147 family)